MEDIYTHREKNANKKNQKTDDNMFLSPRYILNKSLNDKNKITSPLANQNNKNKTPKNDNHVNKNKFRKFDSVLSDDDMLVSKNYSVIRQNSDDSMKNATPPPHSFGIHRSDSFSFIPILGKKKTNGSDFFLCVFLFIFGCVF